MKRGKDLARVRLRVIGTLALLGWLLLLLLPWVARAQASASPKRVLVLYWYNKDHPWNIQFDQSFQATLQSAPEGNVETYSEYLESNRFPGESQSLVLRDYLKQKYADLSIDVVVATSDASLDFLLKYREDLFPQAPVVFVASRSPSQEKLPTGPGLTGILSLNTHRENLDLALSLHPGTKQVFIISGTLERDKRFETLARKELQGYESKVELVYLTDLSLEELIAKVKGLPERSIVLHVWQQSRNEQGKVLENSEMLGPVARSATVPVYAMNFLTLFSQSEHSIADSGVVGGVINTAEASGTRVAEIALRIANGARANDIPIEPAPTVAMFDFRELRRWDIDESKLPARSIVRFRQPTVWEQYKWRIIGVISLCVIEALLIVGLFINRTRRRQAQKESQRLGELAKAEHRRLDEVVSNVPGLVWEIGIDPVSGKQKTLFVSAYVEQMLGYRAEDFLGTTGFGLSLIPEEDRERVERETNDIFGAGASGTVQFRWQTKEGRVLWVESHLTTISDENGKPVGLRGVTMNITDRKRAEEALTENQAQLAGIIGSAMDAIISIDERQRVVLFNAAAETMFGCSTTEALGQPINRFIPTPFRDARQDQLSALKQTDGKGPSVGSFGPLSGRRATGENFPVDVSISEVELNGARFYTIILRDITERLRAEEALRERRQELTEAQRVAKVGSWEWNPLTDTVTWSEEMFRIMKRDPALPAPSYAEHPFHYTQESWQRLKSAVEKALRDGTPYELELEMIRADGSTVWTNARGEVLRDSAGKIVKLRGTLQDIAERKLAEAALQKAVEEVSQLKNKLEEENVYLREEIKLAHSFDEIVGRSDVTRYVLFKIEQVAPTDTSVLITGETGTGKELVARAIHSSSLRKDRPLVRVNCAALTPTLVESELFGHEKGAFTGATARKIGRFELANEATIFLDEIGELPLELQSKLLRVIQEGEFERLGSSKTIKVDVRIIAATNRNLKMAVEQGGFREDLWYRLNVFPITVPPLRDRKEDIPVLVEHFVRRFSQKVGKKISSISPGSLRILQDYAWPGNVRELANVLERAVINTNGAVLRIVDHFEKPRVDQLTQSDKTLEEMEKEYIIRILESTGWRIDGRKGAARILGLNPSTLRTRMTKLGIQKVDQSPALASAAK